MWRTASRAEYGAHGGRTLIVYNDTFRDETVTVVWQVELDGKRVAGDERTLDIPLGEHSEIEIAFTPPEAGDLTLTLVSKKQNQERFRDTKQFVATE